MKFARPCRWLAAATMAAAHLEPAIAAAPYPTGAWIVRQVAVDDQDERNAVFKKDDPRLVDRIMRIGTDGALDFNRTAEACGKVEWKALPKLKLSRLVAQTFRRLPEYGRPRTPTLSDFGLQVHDQSVAPLQAICHAGDGNTAPAPWGHTPWFVSLGDAKLAVAYDGAGVLLLDALPPTAPVRPSFDCQRAGSPAEKAICSSQELAGFDRSVARVYASVLQEADDRRRAPIIQEQQAWLKSRDACEANVECLQDSMNRRLGLLVQY